MLPSRSTAMLVLTMSSYLNGKCEEEGLYRVSGGLANVRRWRRRFDTGEIKPTDLVDTLD